ncbi:hypothetical protein ACLMJK_006037 [Lecanora helva]
MVEFSDPGLRHLNSKEKPLASPTLPGSAKRSHPDEAALEDEAPRKKQKTLPDLGQLTGVVNVDESAVSSGSSSDQLSRPSTSGVESRSSLSSTPTSDSSDRQKASRKRCRPSDSDDQENAVCKRPKTYDFETFLQVGPPGANPTSSATRKKGGRPRTKRAALTKPLKKPTVLRRNHPVKTRLPMDIWERIFSHSKPDALFKLRSVCRAFRDQLADPKIWEASLEVEFGASLPPAPEGLDPMNYANLLVSSGCQSCHHANIRKTYWAFGRRYCDHCLKRHVVFERELRINLHTGNVWPAGLNNNDNVLNSLPYGRFDSWSHYESAGDYSPRPSWVTSRLVHAQGSKMGFLRSDVTKITNEFVAKFPNRDDPALQAEITKWWGDKISKKAALISHLQSIEDFVENRRVARNEVSSCSKQERIWFIREKASKLNPPIDNYTLNSCDCYLRLITATRPPADLERAWKTLLPKLLYEVMLIDETVKEIEHESRGETYHSDNPEFRKIQRQQELLRALEMNAPLGPS